jgi:hypothetical protein
LDAHWAQSSAASHSGTYSVKLSGTGDWCALKQDVTVTANTNYTFSFYGKCSTAGSNFKVLDTSNNVIVNGGNVTGNNTWTLYSVSFNSGSRTTVRVYLGDGGGTNYYDDFSVQ